MSNSSRFNDSPDTSGYITERPNPRVSRSSEEENTDRTDSEREVNNQGNDSHNLSQLPTSFPRQPSPMDLYQQRMAREARYPSGNPYAAGPSRVSDRYSWEAMMRRDLNIGNPNVAAGIPVQRTTGMTKDEFRMMQEMNASLNQCRALIYHQNQLLYETSQALEMVPDCVERAIESAKRKNDFSSGSGYRPNQRQRTVKNFAIATPKRKRYVGALPLCNKCNLHHHGNCFVCSKCKKTGHIAKFCKAEIPNKRKNRACYECGSQDHLRNACPKVKQ